MLLSQRTEGNMKGTSDIVKHLRKESKVASGNPHLNVIQVRISSCLFYHFNGLMGHNIRVTHWNSWMIKKGDTDVTNMTTRLEQIRQGMVVVEKKQEDLPHKKIQVTSCVVFFWKGSSVSSCRHSWKSDMMVCRWAHLFYKIGGSIANSGGVKQYKKPNTIDLPS